MKSRSTFVALCLLFVCSGACGLTYQVLWLRLLALVFGVTVHAASTVLASFMAGLALGSLLAERLARRGHPLRVFAALEAGIAVSALATPVLLGAAEGLYRPLSALAGDSLWVLTAGRFVASFAVLLVPTVLMGATLPVLSRADLIRASGARLGALYTVNTTGAVAGALLTGLVLIGGIGIQRTFLLAASLNLASPASPGGCRPAHPLPVAAEGWHRRSRKPRRRAVSCHLVFGAMAVSGVASLALENRLVPDPGPVPARHLVRLHDDAGDGARRHRHRQRPGLARADASPRLEHGARADHGRDRHRRADVAGGARGHLCRRLARLRGGAGIGSGDPAAGDLMGFAFPIALALWTRPRDRSDATRPRSARCTPPTWSAASPGRCSAGSCCCRGWAAAAPSSSAPPCTWRPASCCWRPRAAGWPRSPSSSSSCWPPRAVPDPFDATLARRHGRGERIFWKEEGVQTSVSIHTHAFRGWLMYLNGLHQASDAPEMVRLHRLIGHLPMVLHPDPRRALVVGLGGGATPGAVSQHDTDVLVVELSDTVRKGAEFFKHVNYDLFARPNVHFRVDDGRNFLSLTDQRFDVVTADLIQPIHAGAGNLYSREYFQLVHDAVADDGLVLQWIGHRSEAQYKLIMRTFLDVFPYSTLWFDGQLLVGSKRPLRISPAAFAAKRARAETRAALDEVGLDSFATLTSWYRGRAGRAAPFRRRRAAAHRRSSAGRVPPLAARRRSGGAPGRDPWRRRRDPRADDRRPARRAIETVFLDAGGVLVHPNWVRVAGALARHGVAVDAGRLIAAEPRAKLEMDRGLADGPHRRSPARLDLLRRRAAPRRNRPRRGQRSRAGRDARVPRRAQPVGARAGRRRPGAGGAARRRRCGWWWSPTPTARCGRCSIAST